MLTVADVVLGGGAMHNLTRNSGACRRGSPVLLPVFVAALLVTGAGCRMALPERKIEAKVYPQQDITVTQNQARLRMRALVDPMCGAIEQAADAIIAGTTHRTVHQAAYGGRSRACRRCGRPPTHEGSSPMHVQVRDHML